MTKLESAFPEIDGIFTKFVSDRHIPGMIWGVVIDGRLAHVKATGVSTRVGDLPVTADTVFRIASMTKSFTSLAVLKLRDEGKLSLDDPAERYVPELRGLKYPTDDSPRITIRHLLSHAEGFPEDNPWGDRRLADPDEQLSAMMRGGIPFSNAPGMAYEYSNYGFAILGRIVSRVSGRPYGDYVAANILKPLGMVSTTLHPSAVPPDRLAHGYRWEDEQWKEERLLADGSFGAMGGILTSVPGSRQICRGADVGLASTRRPGDGADSPLIHARDAADLSTAGGHGDQGAGVRRNPAQPGRLRVWFACVSNVQPQPRRVPRRRAAGLRVVHALAAGAWCRHRHAGQRDLHGLGWRRWRGVRPS